MEESHWPRHLPRLRQPETFHPFTPNLLSTKNSGQSENYQPLSLESSPLVDNEPQASLTGLPARWSSWYDYTQAPSGLIDENEDMAIVKLTEMPRLQQSQHLADAPESEPSLQHLTNCAVSESLDHRVATVWPETQTPELPSLSSLFKGNGLTLLPAADCWDCSWASLPDNDSIKRIQCGLQISKSCLRILLAKNVEKQDGLMLLSPSYFDAWLCIAVKDRPLPPKCFEQTLLVANAAQMILVPAYFLGTLWLFAISRSALGISPLWLYCFDNNPFTDSSRVETTVLSFFDWLFQTPIVSLKVQIVNKPAKFGDSEIYLILTAIALAKIHSSGQLPRDIDDGQNSDDILFFRQHAITQLNNFLQSENPPRQPSITKSAGDSAHSGNNGNFRFIQFENGRQKRQKLEGKPPCRSGPLSQATLSEMKEIRRHGGACERCKKLRKKCDNNDPCNQCRNRDPRKISNWSGPCIRLKSKASRRVGKDKLEAKEREGFVTKKDAVMEDDREEVTKGASSAKSLEDLYGGLETSADEVFCEDGDDADSERVLKLILALKSDAGFNNVAGISALCVSIESNNIKMASLLLENIASWPDLNDTSGLDGFLNQAVLLGRTDFVQLFIHHGANILFQDKYGRGCHLHYSINSAHIDTSSLLIQRMMSLVDDDLQSIGWTKLHKAIIEGNEDKVRETLKLDIDLQINDCAGWTVLDWAAWKGNLAIFELLIKAGAKIIYSIDSAYANSLHSAASYGSSSIVQYLVETGKIPLHQQTKRRWTALHFAAKSNSTKVAQILIDAGLYTNALAYCGQSPLYIACKAGSASVASLLLRHGARPGLKEKAPLLSEASRNGLTGVLEILLLRYKHTRGSHNKNSENFALHEALLDGIRARETECVRKLLEYGADHSYVGKSSFRGRRLRESAIHVAVRSGSVNIVKLLQPRILDWELVDDRGDTPKSTALEKQYFCIAKLFEYGDDAGDCWCRKCRGLEQDLDLEFVDDLGSLTKRLHLAAEIGDVSMVRKLIHRGVSVNTELGWIEKHDWIEVGPWCKTTTLHMAVVNGHDTVVSMLLKAGADYKVKDYFGFSPLDRAISMFGETSSIAATLIAAGAKPTKPIILQTRPSIPTG